MPQTPMPANIEAEQSLLGLLLWHTKLIPTVDTLIDDASFYKQEHNQIYLAMQAVATKGDALDPIPIEAQLEQLGITKLNGMPAISYLYELQNREIERMSSHEEREQRGITYARLIADKALRRDLIITASKLIAIAENDSVNPLAETMVLLTKLDKSNSSYNSLHTIHQFSDLMSKQLPPIKWIVQGIIAEGMTVLAGKQKIGKSWLLLALGLAVACGGIFLNHYQLEQREVLYLALEDNERRLQDRMKILLPPGATMPRGFHYALRWPKLDGNGLQKLKQWLDDHPNVSIVMIDTWGRAKPDVKSRNGYDADVEAAKGVQELAMERNLSIIVTAHLRKAAADDALDELNATTGLSATADNILILKRERGKADASLFGTGREIDLDLALSFADGFWKSLGNGQTYRLSAERKAVIDVLNSSNEPLGAKEIAQLLSTPAKSIHESTMRKRLFDMKNAGEIKELERGKYISLIGNVSNVGNAGNVSIISNASENVTTLPVSPKTVTRLNGHYERSEGYEVTNVTNVTSDEAKEVFNL